MSRLIIPQNTPLYHALFDLAENARAVFFAGLPGVGKSLYVQQTALMAQTVGRQVHLLQWDVTRAAFETPAMLARYPEIDGVTHAAIRKAVGLWARSGVQTWLASHAAEGHLLVGEVPLVGNRLSELVMPHDDAAEAILRDEGVQFVVPVPSASVRGIIEQKRQQTIAAPQHEKERRDAPPNVLQAIWRELYALAHTLGLTDRAPGDHPPYDPDVYAAVYQHLLTHRHARVLRVDTVLRPAASVYDLANVVGQVMAAPDEAARIMAQLERDMTPSQIEAAVAGWYNGGHTGRDTIQLPNP